MDLPLAVLLVAVVLSSGIRADEDPYFGPMAKFQAMRSAPGFGKVRFESAKDLVSRVLQQEPGAVNNLDGWPSKLDTKQSVAGLREFLSDGAPYWTGKDANIKLTAYLISSQIGRSCGRFVAKSRDFMLEVVHNRRSITFVGEPRDELLEAAVVFHVCQQLIDLAKDEKFREQVMKLQHKTDRYKDYDSSSDEQLNSEEESKFDELLNGA